MLDFIKEYTLLFGWIIFVFAVYIYACLDYIYYRYNFKDKILHIYETLTEEE